MEKVAVYFDWQNVYQHARRAFDLGAFPNEYGNVSPYRLAKLLAAANGRGDDVELVRVEVHRGLPSNGRDPSGYAANRRQAQAWMKENPDVVMPRLRPLRYPGDGEADQVPREKGIDVQLAIGAVEHVLTNHCDIAIIVSHDSDLLPAVETICRVTSHHHVETASWASEDHQTRIKRVGNVFNHYMDRSVFDAVQDLTNYAHKV